MVRAAVAAPSFAISPFLRVFSQFLSSNISSTDKYKHAPSFELPWLSAAFKYRLSKNFTWLFLHCPRWLSPFNVSAPHTQVKNRLIFISRDVEICQSSAGKTQKKTLPGTRTSASQRPFDFFFKSQLIFQGWQVTSNVEIRCCRTVAVVNQISKDPGAGLSLASGGS